MANVNVDGTIEAHGFSYYAEVLFTDAADTVDLTVTIDRLSDGQPVDPVAVIAKAYVLLLDNGDRDFLIDAMTGKFAGDVVVNGRAVSGTSLAGIVGQNFSQTKTGVFVNAGTARRTGVRLKVGADRAAGANLMPLVEFK